MGQGYDFVRRKALEQAKQQLQKLVANNITDKNPFQLARINNTQDEATLPTGETVEVQIAGTPGQYATISNGLIIAPEPIQTQCDSAPSKAYIAGWDGTNHYIRRVGSNQKFIIPETGFDPRIDRNQIQIRISADGKGLLIGGFYLDYPPFSAYSYQISSGTGGCQGNCGSIPGYTYHTFAQYNVFMNFKLISPTEGAVPQALTYDYMYSGLKDLNADATGYIPAPVSRGFGSASIYRLFPTATDILGSSEGYRVDIAGNPVDARFFPEVYNTYTWSNPDWESPIDFFSPNFFYGMGGVGTMNTSWSNIGNPTLPLFYNGPGVPVAVEDSQILFVFAPNSDGTSYYIDVVSDTTFATLYKVDSVRYEINNTANYWRYSVGAHAECPNVVNIGNADELYYIEFVYELGSGVFDDPLYSQHYPYLSQFYQSFSDQWIISASSYSKGLGNGTNTQEPQHTYANWGSITSYTKDPIAGCVNDGGPLDFAMSRTICEATTFPSGQNCVYWKGNGSAGWGGGLLSQSIYSWIYNWVYTNTYQVINWDGSGATLTDTAFEYGFPSGLEGFIAYFSIATCNGCSNPYSSFNCYCGGFLSYMVDNSYRQYGFVGTGYINAYRYGRANASFEKIRTIRYDPQSKQYSSDSNDYLNNPAVALFRLTSHINQNRLYTAFRGTSGGTALSYQDSDPYTPPVASSGPPLSYQQVIDALNGDAIYEGTNVFYNPTDAYFEAYEPFYAYYYSSPYVANSVSFINPENIQQPPEVVTDRLISPQGTWPFRNNLYLNAIDSLIVDGYNIETVDGNRRETITEYTSDDTGLTVQTAVISGDYQIEGEVLKDYVLAIKL